jgi:hypothetical protein
VILNAAESLRKRGSYQGNGLRVNDYPRRRQFENRVDIDLRVNHDSSSHRILVMVEARDPRPLGVCRSLGWIVTLNSGRRVKWSSGQSGIGGTFSEGKTFARRVDKVYVLDNNKPARFMPPGRHAARPTANGIASL